MGNMLSQSGWIPTPPLTEQNLPDQTGKVVIVTGGNAGVGFELCKILYSHNATVYLAGRSEEKCNKALAAIKTAAPDSKGQIAFLKLDLGDLASIKASADEFLSKEKRLDWLCNNAGVMIPPKGSKTTQGYDLQLGTNCLGPWLFTQHLHPILKSTAASSPPNSVRVAWAASLAIDTHAPHGGMTLNENGEPSTESQSIQTIYGVSKAGNLFLASEFGKRTQGEGIVSVCFNPGNLRTELQRHVPKWQDMILSLLVYRAIFGAYTELWCGLSPDLTTEQNGAYVGPWGRIMTVRKDRIESLKTKEEGGSEKAKLFVDWCDRECKKYM